MFEVMISAAQSSSFQPRAGAANVLQGAVEIGPQEGKFVELSRQRVGEKLFILKVLEKMEEENQDVQIDPTSITPPKRKRGRPRKSHLVYPGEKALMPQRLDGKKKTRRKKMDSLSSFADNAFVGQTVHGILDGEFDAGYLLTVRVGDTDTVLRGVVFEAGLSVPISKANDIAPNVKLTKRDESILPPEPPQSTQNATPVAMPSTPVPVLTAPLPVVNVQGTSLSIPDRTTSPLEMGSGQVSFVSLQPNGSSKKSLPESSDQINQEPAFNPVELASNLTVLTPQPAKPVETQMDADKET